MKLATYFMSSANENRPLTSTADPTTHCTGHLTESHILRQEEAEFSRIWKALAPNYKGDSHCLYISSMVSVYMWLSSQDKFY